MLYLSSCQLVLKINLTVLSDFINYILNRVNHEGNIYNERKNLEFCVLLWNIFPFGMSGHRNT